MFLRVLFFLVVTWLVAGVLRLLLGARKERRIPGGTVRRGSTPAPERPPYSRNDIVDARFAEIADDRADAVETDGIGAGGTAGVGDGHAGKTEERTGDRSREGAASEPGRTQDAASASSRRRSQG